MKPLLNTTFLFLLLISLVGCSDRTMESVIKGEKLLAEQGDAIAQFNQGVKYERGNSSQLTKIEIS